MKQMLLTNLMFIFDDLVVMANGQSFINLRKVPEFADDRRPIILNFQMNELVRRLKGEYVQHLFSERRPWTTENLLPITAVS
jgi:hypothetical protein